MRIACIAAWICLTAAAAFVRTEAGGSFLVVYAVTLVALMLATAQIAAFAAMLCYYRSVSFIDAWARAAPVASGVILAFGLLPYGPF